MMLHFSMSMPFTSQHLQGAGLGIISKITFAPYFKFSAPGCWLANFAQTPQAFCSSVKTIISECIIYILHVL